jgi:hypothetical protein
MDDGRSGLPDDVARLLAAERDDVEAVPERVRVRVGQRIAATLGAGAVSGLGGARGGEAAGQGAHGLGATGSAPAIGLSLGAKALVVIALATATGAVLGAAQVGWGAGRLALDGTGAAVTGARAVVAPPSVAPPSVAPPSVAPPSVASAAPSTAAPARSTPSPGSTTPTRSSRIESGSSLAAEQALLDDAQRALSTGAAARALAALDRHAARWPKGLLAEEREALAIRALDADGQRAAARRRAAAFHAAWPASLFRTAVDDALKRP